MGKGTSNGIGNAPRAGTRALTLLATPISGMVLQALADGPKALIDLRRRCGSPAQTTLRAYLKELEAVGAIEKRRSSSFPGAMRCELTGSGKELLMVAEAVGHWLRTAPEGPLAFGGPEAKAAIKALIEGWTSTMLRALAARPLSLTELDGVITGLSYPSLERRLSSMKLARQVEPRPGEGNGTPYAPTAWLRQGIAPLAAAARWERRHLRSETAPLAPLDTETAFLLTLPLLRLPRDLSGSCRLGVEIPHARKRRLAGAMAHVKRGEITSCNVRLEGSANAWVTGSSTAWLEAVIDADTDSLDLGGDQHLARSLVDGLHRALFRARGRAGDIA